ncbi:MAG: DUF438 domain-containing protein [Porphyromonas sp.]|nr:DUF438 domain-containing protein [Porphyromonas sp.]
MDMQQHLPSVDLERLAKVLDIREQYSLGKISLEKGQRLLREQVGLIKPYEIALAEQKLKEIEDDECRKEDIQGMLRLFEGIMDCSRPDLPADHPIMCYYRENDEMRKLLREVERLAPYPVIKNEWLGLYDELAKWRTHLSRKQNQLYSILEQKGFDRPTTTMWLLDDFIRDEIRDTRQLIEADKDEEFIAMQKTIVHDILDLITKEETVLYPTSLAMITPEEFEAMRSGDHEIGFAYIAVTAPGKQATASKSEEATEPALGAGFASELAALLGKYGLTAGGAKSNSEQVLDVATGKLTLEQINLIYQHMPVDISYVDENEIVKFYTDTEHRVFPRSKNVIGRDVKNCHPRTSVHLVEEIIEKFRSGEEDSVDFWINKPGVFIYIYYVAVRDAEGKFRGVLEMMQDCTRIRQLQDSRTLLKWSNDTTGASKHDAKHTETEQPTTAPTESEPKTCSSEEKGGSCSCHSHQQQTADIEITPDTRLKDLLDAYPDLKKELVAVHSSFKMLSSPLARIIIPKADVRIMSERSGVPLEELIAKLGEIIARLRKTQ